MTLCVHIAPTAEQTQPDNGVGQVIHAQYKYLPALGIELTGPEEADVIACHIQQGELPRVDVLHCHGLYWHDIEHAPYQKWHHEANARIVDAARKAIAITVPSRWVAEPFIRDMRITPHVIGHGIDLDDWQPATNKGYVLWNKTRAGDVCDPRPAFELAQRGALVVSTFGVEGSPTPQTMTVIGVQPHETMRKLIRHADVYLATTRETFGIGTLEPLAAGVPVLGYDWGGTAEIVEHEVSGYLVQPGDVDGLMRGLEWLRAHPETRAAARERASRYTWQAAMEQYAAVYHEAAEKRKKKSTVSVVITNYNYGEYVSEAIESCRTQTEPPEIVVVDDGSTDNSAQVLRDMANITLVTQQNQGVAAARNAGISRAAGDYIVCLDADDKLDPRYCEVLRRALDADRGLGIAYSGLGLIQQDGSIALNPWPPQFDWDAQTKPTNPPSNTIPCAAMFRHSMWERAGGYKQVYAPAEDTEFFTRGLSVGYTALKVTDEPLFHYRIHHGSASRTKEYRRIDTWHPWMRDHKYPMAAPSSRPPLVKSYADPLISVIIPCGPGHAKYLPAAIDSILGQTLRDWEVVVAWDAVQREHPSMLLREYPFVKFAFTMQDGAGPAAARNAGLEAARAPLTLFLDADDYLIPDALEKMTRAYLETGKYIYTDWFALRGGEMVAHQSPEYAQSAWFYEGQHAVTVLIETTHARGVGGFDERMKGWEDWDFFVKTAISGVCGQRLAEPLMVYRQDTGTVRERSLAQKTELLAVLKDRYAVFVTGERQMSTCCGGNADALLHAKRVLAEANGEIPGALLPALEVQMGIQEPPVVRMEFIGEQKGAIPFIGRPSGQTYYGADNKLDRYANVDPRDVEHMEGTGVWRRVPGQAPIVIAREETTPAPTVQEPIQAGDERPMLDLVAELTVDEQVVNQQAAKLAKTTRGKGR